MAGGYIGTAPATRDPTVSDDSVTTAKIQDNAVTGAKIAMTSDAAGDVLYYNGTDYTRLAVGAAGKVLKVNSGATAPEWATDTAGTGDVVGPGSSTNDALARFDTTTGKLLQNSTATLSDAGTLTATAFAGALTGNVTGNVTGNIDGTVGATTPSTVVATQVDVTAQGDLRLQDTSGGEYVALQAAGTTTSYTVTLPAAVATVTGQALTSTTAGVASWTTVGDALLAADQNWSGSQRAPLVTDNDGSFDQDGGNNFFCTPSGNVTLTFTNHTGGQSGYILFDNAGGHTISLHANTKGDANLASTLSTAGTYLVSYLDNGTNAYLTTSAVFA